MSRDTRGPMSFVDWLQLLFIALKLTGYIDWSWWLVMSPFIASLVVVIVVAIFDD